jgi:DNA uptake protein ComE-like DNA-binding protein
MVPYREDYKSEDLPVGDASFWFVGRDNDQTPTEDPVFSIVDEASKINLNTAPRSMLEALPGMTPDLVDSIMLWRSRSRTGDTGGNENVYARMDPPRLNKGGTFESVDELRLVYGATMEILLGEDTNRNGAIDENENDGDTSAPRDNSDGLIQPGVLEYLTVSTREPNTNARGQKRANITTAQQRQQFLPALQRIVGQARAQAISSAVTASLGNNNNGQITSVLEYLVRGRVTSDEFPRIRDAISTTDNSTISGLINVNTASETVLSCIPGIGLEYASAIVAYRVAHPDVLTSYAWLQQVMPSTSLIRAGRYITDKSYQFSVDVAAVGNAAGRGYCREKTIFDMRRGTPRIIFHQDLTAYGWALGAQVRENIKQGIRQGRTDRT